MGLSFAKWVRAYTRQTLYAAVAVLGFAQAIAQELQEVVVTAERREEKLQDVPIAVTAFTNATLVSRNMTDIHSLTNLTPSVNLDAGSPFSGDKSVLSASIRGIGQDDFAFNLNPGVGVYLDGVYLARTIGSNLNLLDIERVDVVELATAELIGVERGHRDRHVLELLLAPLRGDDHLLQLLRDGLRGDEPDRHAIECPTGPCTNRYPR